MVPDESGAVPDMHDTRTRNWRRKMESIYGAGFWHVRHGY